ncbi:phosphatidate cytidylyltransferase [Rubritepida flocculans]|uniref:phosphatidate cytidylyltransferase n=1 Tax=Rubritepida flocculans TaxID=182403 RepID=UPI000409F594|nr:phosphatidate cytidylyltransferase [Rubritepida flocculans]
MGAPAAGRWGDLRTRALTAFVLGPAALACMWLGGWWWAGLMGLGVAGLAWEWVRLLGGSTRSLPGALLPPLVLAALLLSALSLALPGLLLLAGGAVLAHAAARRAGGRVPPGWLAFGVAYVGVAGVALIALRQDDQAGRENVIFLFLLVWASDISAYLAGRRFGGAKLWPAVSPNKTWAGALGGLAGALGVGGLAALAFSEGLDPGRLVLICLALGLAAQGGDLLESWIKRRFGVKDSSGLIPGHGGLFDRLDSVLAAAPLAALLGAMLGPGVQLWR